MYVIGRGEYDLIKIVDAEIYGVDSIETKVFGVNYEADMNEATIITDYDRAKKLRTEIQENVDEISFKNASILFNILENETFDKSEYVKELKIFQLTVLEVQEEE